jgi:cell division protease FtsH
LANVDLVQIAPKTPGFVGADLANIVNEAAVLAARQEKDAVETEDFDEAIERVIAGLQKKSRVMNPRENKTVAYHESGHALVAELNTRRRSGFKISIIPRGVAALGYTQQLPTEDRYLMTRSELLARIYVLLGGRVAEEMIFGDVSTGAQNDLQKATDRDHAHHDHQFGMSERLVWSLWRVREHRCFCLYRPLGPKNTVRKRPALWTRKSKKSYRKPTPKFGIASRPINKH